MAAIATSTGTTSGSSGSSETYGNLFSETVTALGTALSKYIGEDGELTVATDTFLAGLMPDILTGSALDVAAGVVGGALALGAGLVFSPEEALLAGAGAAVALYYGEEGAKAVLSPPPGAGPNTPQPNPSQPSAPSQTNPLPSTNSQPQTHRSYHGSGSAAAYYIPGSIRLSPRYRLDNQAGLMGVAA